jgi:hypothetical protein
MDNGVYREELLVPPRKVVDEVASPPLKKRGPLLHPPSMDKHKRLRLRSPKAQVEFVGRGLR